MLVPSMFLYFLEDFERSLVSLKLRGLTQMSRVEVLGPCIPR
jgi:hypothetical protein